MDIDAQNSQIASSKQLLKKEMHKVGRYVSSVIYMVKLDASATS